MMLTFEEFTRVILAAALIAFATAYALYAHQTSKLVNRIYMTSDAVTKGVEQFLIRRRPYIKRKYGPEGCNVVDELIDSARHISELKRSGRFNGDSF